MDKAIIVANAGSTSLRFASYSVNMAGTLDLLHRAQIQSMPAGPTIRVIGPNAPALDSRSWSAGDVLDAGVRRRGYHRLS